MPPSPLTTQKKNAEKTPIIAGCIEVSQWVYTHTKQNKTNNKQTNTINSLVCRSFSINIYSYATNTLYPILIPPKKSKAKKPEKKTQQKQIIGECKAVSQWIYIYAQQILYIQSSSPLPHTHKTKQANKQTNKYSRK